MRRFCLYKMPLYACLYIYIPPIEFIQSVYCSQQFWLKLSTTVDNNMEVYFNPIFLKKIIIIGCS